MQVKMETKTTRSRRKSAFVNAKIKVSIPLASVGLTKVDFFSRSKYPATGSSGAFWWIQIAVIHHSISGDVELDDDDDSLT